MAQDIHFSQPVASPVLLNPANSGLFQGKFRVGAICRNQWASVAKSYQTYGFTGEMVALQRRFQRDGIGVGISFMTDFAGSSRYGSTEGGANVSYFKSLNKKKVHLLSLGANFSFGQKGFSTENMVLPSGGTEENFENTSITYPSLGLGLAWQYELNKEIFFQAGVAAFHLNQPSLDFFLSSDEKLPIRTAFNFQSDMRLWDKLALVPSVFFQQQKNSFEALYGTDLKWYIKETYFTYFTFSGGLYFRQSDALVLALKSEYNAWQFFLSYDTNLSSLRKASNTIGSFEIAVLYIFQKKRRLGSGEIPCPVF